MIIKELINLNRLVQKTISPPLVIMLALSCISYETESSNFGSLIIKIESFSNSLEISTKRQTYFNKVNNNSITFLEFGRDLNSHDQDSIKYGIKVQNGSDFNSQIKNVKITVGDLSPVDIEVTGVSVSATINDIPVGDQLVNVELQNKNQETIFEESQTVLIVADEIAVPTFNNFERVGFIFSEGFEETGNPNNWWGESYVPGSGNYIGSSFGTRTTTESYEGNYSLVNPEMYGVFIYANKTIDVSDVNSIYVKFYYKFECDYSNEGNFGFIISPNVDERESSMMAHWDSRGSEPWTLHEETAFDVSNNDSVILRWRSLPQGINDQGICRYYIDEIKVY